MNIHKALTYLRNKLRSVIKGTEYKPKILSYLITNKCNSHCISCSAWKQYKLEYIDIVSLRNVLSDPLFSMVQHVGISGGEPSTFEQLEEHIDVIIEVLPKIETLSITSNCILSDYWILHLQNINNKCIEKNIHFQFNISLDGIKIIHDKIRGTKNNFENIERVINHVSENDIAYQLHTTIDKYNIYHIGAILDYAKFKKADIIFRLASEIHRLNNEKQINRISLNKKQISFLCDFLQSKALLCYTKSPGRKLFYKSLVKQLLNNTGRTAPCYFKHQGLVLSSDGSLSYCSRFPDDFGNIYMGKDLLEEYKCKTNFDNCSLNVCNDCHHDQTGLWPVKTVISQIIGNKMAGIIKSIQVSKYIIKCMLLPSRKEVNSTIKSVIIIGMYGGEHVGDAAILGGVIHRKLLRYPSINDINIYSFRPDRTTNWVEGLSEINMPISILGTEKAVIDKIRTCQLVIWAGGPIMELPIVLSRNYYFIRAALNKGLRFEIEGVGFGPMNTVFGKYIGGNIIKKAKHITFRSESDKKKFDFLTNLDSYQKAYDPAYDYLKLIPKDIYINEDTERSIKHILTNTKRKILALNLRPLWLRYGTNENFHYESFIREIVSVIDNLSLKDVTTIYFPMNADQYGFSDFDVAYHIQRLINPNTDFRIWEMEPSVSELIYLLRKVDGALCMRFHAVIFSISQGIPTIGIDYSLSGKGKVASLFDHQEDCVSILDFKANQIESLLLSKLNI